jgi:hypothetical protein
MYDTQKNMGIDEHKIIKYGSTDNKRMSLVPHLAEKQKRNGISPKFAGGYS